MIYGQIRVLREKIRVKTKNDDDVLLDTVIEREKKPTKIRMKNKKDDNILLDTVIEREEKRSKSTYEE